MKMTQEPQPVAFHITGLAPPNECEAEHMLMTMRNCVRRFINALGRFPEQNEADMLWSATQRYHRVPERFIEPGSERRIIQ